MTKLLARVCSPLAGALYLFILTAAGPAARAQIPFFTDDAGTTEKGKFHLEFYNAHDLLQKTSYPGQRQNTTVLTVNYGVTERLELGVNAPFIKIFNAAAANLGNPSGVGDTQFGLKYRLRDERERSRLPALGVVFYVEAPTGSTRKQIGSGIFDYYLYGIAEKTLTERLTGRVNGGIVFAGNTSTGLVGIETTKGRVYTGNISLVRKFTDRFDLGAEIFGGVASNQQLSRGQLTAQIGGDYALGERFTLAFGVLGGKFPGSTRGGALLGFAYDFK